MLKRILIKPYLFILRHYHWLKIHIEGRWLLLSTKRCHVEEILIKNGKILVLAPHSDDEWIGCSTILKKLRDSVTVINMDMEGGDSDALHKNRYDEMKTASESCGYKLEKIEGNKVNWLSDYIINHSPKYVLVPCYYDWHDEHYEVMDVLKDALEASKIETNVVMYQVSIPMPPSLINCYHSLDKNEHEEKWRLLDVYYPSQSFLPTFRFRLNERINGKRFGAYAAEVFSVSSSEKWINDYKNNALSLQEREYYKRNLNNIKQLYKKLSAL